MTYIEIRDLLQKNGIKASISLDIVSCVQASLWSVDKPITDEDFTAICNYVRAVWDNVDKTYTQLIADVVVDCIYHCFDYYECKKIKINMKKINEQLNDETFDKVVQAYLNKYYD